MSFSNFNDKITKHEFVKNFVDIINKNHYHIADSDRHITEEDRERWNRNMNNYSDYNDNGPSFFSLEAKKKLEIIEEFANNYVHPKGDMTPGRYLEVYFDEYGHVNYANNPKRIYTKVNNSIKINNLNYNSLLFSNGTNFPKNFLINTNENEMVDRSAVNLNYFYSNTIDSSIIIGDNLNNVSAEDYNKIFINEKTDTAYFFDGDKWVKLSNEFKDEIKLDNEGFIPEEYIPDIKKKEAIVGELAYCLSLRPPRGWIALDGRTYKKKDLPELWEFVNKAKIVSKSNDIIYENYFIDNEDDTFSVPRIWKQEMMYTTNLISSYTIKPQSIKRLKGKLRAYYDFTKNENIAFNGFSSKILSDNDHKYETIHPGRLEALANKITYKNLVDSNEELKLPYNTQNDKKNFSNIALNYSKVVHTSYGIFRPNQMNMNFIIRACKDENDFPDHLYNVRSYHVKPHFFALDVFNKKIINKLDYENSLSAYVSNNLYLKRIILDLSRFFSDELNFELYGLEKDFYAFNDIRVEFVNITGVKKIIYPFSPSANFEFLSKLCLEPFVSENEKIPDDCKVYNDIILNSKDQEGKKERPVSKIVYNLDEDPPLEIIFKPLFADDEDLRILYYLVNKNSENQSMAEEAARRTGKKYRKNTIITIDKSYYTPSTVSYNINFKK